MNLPSQASKDAKNVGKDAIEATNEKLIMPQNEQLGLFKLHFVLHLLHSIFAGKRGSFALSLVSQ
jgi:hypothetical protein